MTTENTKNTEAATPETDAEVTTFTSISKLKRRFECSTGKVSAEFARRLERERDQAREAADKWRKLHDTKDELFKKGIAEVERERDKAREDATNYYARIGELEKERDEAREAFRELWQSADAYLAACNPETIKRWRRLAGWEAK